MSHGTGGGPARQMFVIFAGGLIVVALVWGIYEALERGDSEPQTTVEPAPEQAPTVAEPEPEPEPEPFEDHDDYGAGIAEAPAEVERPPAKVKRSGGQAEAPAQRSDTPPEGSAGGASEDASPAPDVAVVAPKEPEEPEEGSPDPGQPPAERAEPAGSVEAAHYEGGGAEQHTSGAGSHEERTLRRYILYYLKNTLKAQGMEVEGTPHRVTVNGTTYTLKTERGGLKISPECSVSCMEQILHAL